MWGAGGQANGVRVGARGRRAQGKRGRRKKRRGRGFSQFISFIFLSFFLAPLNISNFPSRLFFVQRKNPPPSSLCNKQRNKPTCSPNPFFPNKSRGNIGKGKLTGERREEIKYPYLKPIPPPPHKRARATLPTYYCKINTGIYMMMTHFRNKRSNGVPRKHEKVPKPPNPSSPSPSPSQTRLISNIPRIPTGRKVSFGARGNYSRLLHPFLFLVPVRVLVLFLFPSHPNMD